MMHTINEILHTFSAWLMLIHANGYLILSSLKNILTDYKY